MTMTDHDRRLVGLAGERISLAGRLARQANRPELRERLDAIDAEIARLEAVCQWVDVDECALTQERSVAGVGEPHLAPVCPAHGGWCPCGNFAEVPDTLDVVLDDRARLILATCGPDETDVVIAGIVCESCAALSPPCTPFTVAATRGGAARVDA